MGQRLWSLVKRGGWLAIMTQLRDSVEDFVHWYYKNDQTHISFFSRHTFAWLAQRDHLEVEFHGKAVILLQRKT